MGMVAVTVSISGTRRAPCVSLVFTEALDSPFPHQMGGETEARRGCLGDRSSGPQPGTVRGTGIPTAGLRNQQSKPLRGGALGFAPHSFQEPTQATGSGGPQFPMRSL